MFLFSQILRPLIYSKLKVRNRKWPEDYFIYRKEDTLIDSMGNVYAHSWETFVSEQSEVLNNAGHVWEVYQEIMDQNL